MASLPPSETLILEIDDGWLQIRFNRPEARNALSDEMASDLMGVLQRVAEDRSVRGIMLRGEGNIFCAGGDLKGFQKSLTGTFTQEEAEAMSRSAGALFARINSMPQVVVAIVEGAAIAGGLGMACCADFVIAKEDAKFSLTETLLGISPAQIAPYVIQRTGQMTARRMMLTGAKFTATEAHALGIVDIVAPSTERLAKAADEIKASVRRCAPGANAVTKEIALASGHLNRDEMIAFAAKGFAKCMLSDEGREGILSFVEKRKPSWAKSD